MIQTKSLGTVFLAFFCVCSVFAQSNNAKQTFEEIAIPTSYPEWLQVKQTERVNKNIFLQKTKEIFDLNSSTNFKTKKTKTDELNWTHHRLQQTYKNIPIEGGEYILHEKEGVIEKANGRVIRDLDLEATPDLSDAAALQILLNTVNATKYAWEDEAMELTIKDIKQDLDATYCPKGSLVWVDPTFEQETQNYQLAYKFDVFSVDPYERYYYYISAKTGEILTKISRIHENDAQGTGETNYYGTVDITTDNFNGFYRLREYERGNNGIETYNSNNTTSYPTLDFTDLNNSWTNTHTACEAHWGSEKTYDYFKNEHGRNSFDDDGAKIKSWVHYDVDYVNAFWNGSHMTYGDGNGTSYGALTCLDVVGHEITHAITERTAGLIYQNESGALNESFSDIFGTAIEFAHEPNTANKDWYMGEDANITGNGFRDMSNPKAKGDPNTYGGVYWYTGSLDYGGVHTNSGVQNFWFYLLSEGGAGINDNNTAYDVSGIGMTKAAKIAFRNLTIYLTSTSNYVDAYNGSVQAATDLYGAGSDEVKQVENAWCAVGLGECDDTPAGELTMIYPNGNETIISGSTIDITWSSSGMVGNLVKILYSPNGGTTWNLITNGTPNDGLRNWTVPNINTNLAIIKVVDYYNHLSIDASDETFTITPNAPSGQLTLNYPDGGEVIAGGSNINLTWTSTGNVNNTVKLYYSLDDGANWTLITNATSNDGSRNWSVPDINTTGARIRIVDATNNMIVDESNTSFSISTDSPTCDANSLELGADIYLPDNGNINLSTELYNMAYTLWDYQGALISTTSSVSVSNPGLYVAAVTDSCGNTEIDSIHVLTSITGEVNVWPGDMNFDGVVNFDDMDTYGLYFGKSGAERLDKDMLWNAHYSSDWEEQQHNGADLKHVDANGDGIVDITDGFAIQNNYSKTHNETVNTVPSFAENGLFKVYLQPTDIPSFTGNDNLLVMDLVIANEDLEDIAFYGGHFTVSYNNPLGLILNPQISFNDSWLGTPNVDLFYGSFNDEENQEIHIGVTRLDRSNRIGSGKIGTITFEVNQSSMGFTSDLFLDFEIDGSSFHNSEALYLPIGGQETSIGIIGECPNNLIIAPYNLLPSTQQVANNISTTGNVKVLDGQDVTFKVNDALLNADFSVELGASFGVDIDPCIEGEGANKPINPNPTIELYIQDNKRHYIINK